MFGDRADLKASPRFTTLTISAIAYLALLGAVPIAGAAATYAGTPKPTEFYLHPFDTPVLVAGLDSKYKCSRTWTPHFAANQKREIQQKLLKNRGQYGDFEES